MIALPSGPRIVCPLSVNRAGPDDEDDELDDEDDDPPPPLDPPPQAATVMAPAIDSRIERRGRLETAGRDMETSFQQERPHLYEAAFYSPAIATLS
jgi:hypothetical protein